MSCEKINILQHAWSSDASLFPARLHFRLEFENLSGPAEQIGVGSLIGEFASHCFCGFRILLRRLLSIEELTLGQTRFPIVCLSSWEPVCGGSRGLHRLRGSLCVCCNHWFGSHAFREAQIVALRPRCAHFRTEFSNLSSPAEKIGVKQRAWQFAIKNLHSLFVSRSWLLTAKELTLNE